MSKNHIPITFNTYSKKSGVKDVRLRENAAIADIERAINDALREFRREFDALIDTYNREVIYKVNELKTNIERTQQASTTSLITNINTGIVGGGGSGTTSKTIVPVLKAVTGGVTIAEVFAAPSLLLGTPIVETYIDGMQSPVVTLPDEGTLTVLGFSITPAQSGNLRYAYQYI